MEKLDYATELLAHLVGFDTISANSNLALIDFVADRLDRHGIACRLTHDDDRRKANLYATIGPGDRGGYVLSGHTDVVPVAGQEWSSDPFVMRESGGRLYGRGTADMKGFIACVLAMVPDFAARDLAIPIHLAFSYDEEVGCIGVHRMLEMIARELPRPRLAVIGEPTGMRVVTGHKGISVQETVVTGREAHSSRPHEGVNAIAYAGEIVGFIQGLAREYAVPSGPEGEGFDPPGTTFNIGRIAGGTAINIIARECRVDWEFRMVPGVDPAEILAKVDDFVAAEILPRMRAVDPRSTVVTTCRVASPTLRPRPGNDAERLAAALTGDNATGLVSYVTEAGVFDRAGIPAVVCGPGDIAQAHAADEFIEAGQLASCLKFLQRVAATATQTPH